MTILVQTLVYGMIGLATGYLLGRVGHCYVNVWIQNPSWLPHHWIYGALLIPTSSFFISSTFGLILLMFGVGHFISDFKDFTELKFFTPDTDEKKRFFHID